MRKRRQPFGSKKIRPVVPPFLSSMRAAGRWRLQRMGSGGDDIRYSVLPFWGFAPQRAEFGPSYCPPKALRPPLSSRQQGL